MTRGPTARSKPGSASSRRRCHARQWNATVGRSPFDLDLPRKLPARGRSSSCTWWPRRSHASASRRRGSCRPSLHPARARDAGPRPPGRRPTAPSLRGGHPEWRRRADRLFAGTQGVTDRRPLLTLEVRGVNRAVDRWSGASRRIARIKSSGSSAIGSRIRRRNRSTRDRGSIQPPACVAPRATALPVPGRPAAPAQRPSATCEISKTQNFA